MKQHCSYIQIKCGQYITLGNYGNLRCICVCQIIQTISNHATDYITTEYEAPWTSPARTGCHTILHGHILYTTHHKSSSPVVLRHVYHLTGTNCNSYKEGILITAVSTPAWSCSIKYSCVNTMLDDADVPILIVHKF